MNDFLKVVLAFFLIFFGFFNYLKNQGKIVVHNPFCRNNIVLTRTDNVFSKIENFRRKAREFERKEQEYCRKKTHGLKKTRSLYQTILLDSASKYGIPKKYALMLPVVESDGNYLAHNKKTGAKGLLQIKFSTAKIYGCKSEKELFQPNRNISYSFQYLCYLKEGFGNWETALIAYNVGETDITSFIKAKEFDKNDFAFLKRLEAISKIEI